jgi:hypothetical protein
LRNSTAKRRALDEVGWKHLAVNQDLDKEFHFVSMKMR